MINNKKYPFDAALAGQVDLATANNELLDNVRYSIAGDTRDLFVVKKQNAPVFIFDKNKGCVHISNKKLREGLKLKGLGKLDGEFNYCLKDMLNYGNNLYVSVKKLKKVSNDTYKVTSPTNSFSIVQGKFLPNKKQLKAGILLKGSLHNPVIKKDFSFLVLDDNKDKTLFVKRSHIGDLVSNFEGGDVEDFYGGDINFTGSDKIGVSKIAQKEILAFDGTERLIGFDSNNDIKQYYNNTEMYFNMDSNVGVLGHYESNAEIDLSFDGKDNYSNAFGDFFKKLFDKKEVNEEQVKDMYKKSGSKKTFKEWLNSDESKDVLKGIANISELLNKIKGDSQISSGGSTTSASTTSSNNSQNKGDVKILGMHPLTFGIVSVVSLVGLGFGAWMIFRKK